MKIAIVTLPLHTNYGGILQAYALQTVLTRMGHSAQVLTKSRKIKITPKLLFLTIPKRILLKLIGKDVNVFREFRHNRIINTISRNVQPFISKNIHTDGRDYEQLKPTDYEAYVVGSDQIWRPKYIGDHLKNAFLDFSKTWDVTRIAYSASFGTQDWEYNEADTKFIKSSLIGLFKAVSVRESSGIDLCKKYFGIKAEHLLDPTLLLNPSDYLYLVNLSKTKPAEGNLFYYILDPTEEKTSFINRIATERSLKPFTNVARPDDWSAPLCDRIQPPLEQWLRSFNDSDFVVTDSFHGCVFSILFHKPFVAIGNKARGMSRFESLLQLLNLKDHLLLDVGDYISFNSYIIPNETYCILEQERKKSFDFLANNLS